MQLEAEPELVHCHVTLTVDALMIGAVTSVGVGGAGVVQTYKIITAVKKVTLQMPTSCWQISYYGVTCAIT